MAAQSLPPVYPGTVTVAQPTNLDKARRRKRKNTAQGRTLCARGFHKWVFDARKQFDVKQGKLISVERCMRCGVSRTHAQ